MIKAAINHSKESYVLSHCNDGYKQHFVPVSVSCYLLDYYYYLFYDYF